MIDCEDAPELYIQSNCVTSRDDIYSCLFSSSIEMTVLNGQARPRDRVSARFKREHNDPQPSPDSSLRRIHLLLSSSNLIHRL